MLPSFRSCESQKAGSVHGGISGSVHGGIRGEREGREGEEKVVTLVQRYHTLSAAGLVTAKFESIDSLQTFCQVPPIVRCISPLR